MPDISPENLLYIEQTLIAMAWEISFFGFFTAVVLMSTWVLIQKGLRTSRARSWLFVINIIMLAISLVHIVLSMKFYIVELPTLTSDVYPDARFQQLRRWKVGLMVLRRVSYLISDAVVVWRTWCIWKDNKWVRLYLAFVLFVTAVTSIITAVISGLRLPVRPLVSNLLGTFPLLVTNFSTTLLCGYKVWEYRRFVKDAFTNRRHKSLVENVLLILVESGSVYCVFWLLLFLGDEGYLSTGPFGPRFGLEWFMPHFSGIYTSLIILVVAMSRSSSDTIFSGIVDNALQSHEKSARFAGTTPVHISTINLNTGSMPSSAVSPGSEDSVDRWVRGFGSGSGI